MKIEFFNKSEHHLDANELVELYTVIGWNKNGVRTFSKTQLVLEKSPYYVQARCKERLVGFGRVITDPFFAIILDLITHPDFRKKGIATEILKRLVVFCRSQALPIQLIDGSGVPGLYEKLGFKQADPVKEKIMYLG